MLRYLMGLLALLTIDADVWADPPSDELMQKVRVAIKEKCPDAEFAVTRDGFTAKSQTMMLTIHRRSKTGEIFPQTDQHEGPSYKGFVLHISQHSGPYQGAAVTPQTLQEPYYQTYIDSPAAGKVGHYFVTVSYGSRLDAELKKAIFEAIPRTTFPKQTIAPEPK